MTNNWKIVIEPSTYTASFEFDATDYLARLEEIGKNSYIEKVEVGHCRDCKHWDANHMHKGFGDCLAVPRISDCSSKELIDISVVATGYDDSGSLLTKSDFGCIQFEVK